VIAPPTVVSWTGALATSSAGRGDRMDGEGSQVGPVAECDPGSHGLFVGGERGVVAAVLAVGDTRSSV
jgi:hypothetical protein